MNVTELVNLGVGLLLIAALAHRPQAIVVALGLSFVSALLAAEFTQGDHIRPVLMSLDALTVIAAWFLWGKYGSNRASLIAWLGMCKILFGIAGGFSPSYLLWAAGNNALFVVMVLVAGDFTNGFLAWLGRGLAGLRARRAGLLRHMARIQ